MGILEDGGDRDPARGSAQEREMEDDDDSDDSDNEGTKSTIEGRKMSSTTQSRGEAMSCLRIPARTPGNARLQALTLAFPALFPLISFVADIGPTRVRVSIIAFSK